MNFIPRYLHNRNIIIYFYRLYLVLTIFLFPFYTNAINFDEYFLLHNSNQCSNYFNYFEDKFKIPKHLLRSISIIETGRWHNPSKMLLPWPWVINHAGTPYYFNTKKEAISKVKELLESGSTSIDIGCMQINLHHHPEAFLNLNQAFEPKDNIEYAANFLLRNYLQLQNWQKAIAYYHSQSSDGDKYAKKVLKIWSEYKDNKPYSTYCSNKTGNGILCNNTTISSQYNKSHKENLPLEKLDDTTNKRLSKLHKDPKRLKSAMILYNIHDE